MIDLGTGSEIRTVITHILSQDEEIMFLTRNFVITFGNTVATDNKISFCCFSFVLFASVFFANGSSNLDCFSPILH